MSEPGQRVVGAFRLDPSFGVAGTPPPTAGRTAPSAAVVRRLAERETAALRRDLERLDPDLGPDVWKCWVEALGIRLADLLDEVLHGELLAWRSVFAPFAGTGQTQAVDVRFVDRVCDHDARWLVETYPEAARLRDVLVRNWADAARELHERLVADRARLAEAFDIPRTAALTQVAPGAGDSHRNGRRVACLVFEGGRRLIYKPRSVRAERVLADLLVATAAASGDTDWPAVRTVEHGEYGWMEFIDHVEARDVAAVRRFFRRAGILVAVAHALGMNDLHMENIIARGDQPVVIDAETLMPADVLGRPGDGMDPAVDEHSRSVLDTGLLPRWLPIYRQRTDLDRPAVIQLGGLGPVHHSRLPGLAWSILDGRHERSVRTASPEVGTNLPTIDGVVQEYSEHVHAVLEGFDAAVEALRAESGRWAEPAGPLNEVWSTPVRVIARNTSAYASALRAATSRGALRDGAVRLAILQHRLGGLVAASRGALESAECQVLRDCDVPLFISEPTASVARSGEVTSNVTTEGGVIGLRRPPAQASALRMAALSSSGAERHLRRQRDLITAAFATPYAIDGCSGGTSGAADLLTLTDGWREVARHRVSEIADHIVGAAVTGKGGVGWLGLCRDRATGRTAVVPAGWGLSDGSLGIALMLAAAGMSLQSTRWDRMVRLVIDSVTTQARWTLGPESPDDGHAVDLGLAGGYGGLVWGLAVLADLLGRDDLATTAVELAELALVRAHRGLGRLDEDGGAGGMVAGLTVLARPGSDRVSGLLVGLRTRIQRRVDEQPSSIGREAVGDPGGTPNATVTPQSSAEWMDGAQAFATRSAAGVTGSVRPAADGRRWSSREDGLRVGTAGRVEWHASSGAVDPTAAVLLDRNATELRLVADGAPTWLVPGLADGLAGVGCAWLRVLMPDRLLHPWADRD